MAGSLQTGVTAQVPIRQNTGTAASAWSPQASHTGMDDVHSFCISTCTDSLHRKSHRLLSDCLTWKDVSYTTTPYMPGSNGHPVYGTIDISIHGGQSPFSYEWTDQAGNTISREEDLTGLQAGTYCLLISDAGCCQTDVCVTVEGCGGVVLGTGLVLTAEVPCETGLIDLQVSGGVMPYGYHWEYTAYSGMGTVNGTASLEDILAIDPGYYCISVTDACGSTANDCYDTRNQLHIELVATTFPSSSNAYDGAIDVTISSNLPPPYTLLWEGPDDFSSDAEDINGLAMGAYTLVVNDNCTSDTLSVILDSCQTAMVSNSKSLFPCKGQDNGKLIFWINRQGALPLQWELRQVWGAGNVVASGTVQQYQTILSDIIAIPDLEEAFYAFTLRDAHGCEDVQNVFLFKNSLAIEAEVNSSCSSEGGSIQLTVDETHVNPPLNYQWNDGITAKDRSGLASGEYCVTVSDFIGCTVSKCFTIENASLSVYVDSVKNNNLCGVTCHGYIRLQTIPATGLSYQWSGPDGYSSQQANISELCNGEYRVTVSNAQGCQVIKTVTICCCHESFHEPEHGEEPPPPSPHLCYNPPYNPENPNPQSPSISIVLVNRIPIDDLHPLGSIDLTVSGGVRDLYFSWSGPNGFRAYTEDIHNLEEGEYCLTVTDGCDEVKKCIKIVDCRNIEWSLNATIRPSCPGAAAGSIEVKDIIGGEAPYTYLWSTGSTQSQVSHLSPGTYTVAIKGNQDCAFDTIFTITEQPPVINVSATIGHTCPGYAYGSIQLTVSGNDPPFAFAWSNGRTTSTVYELAVGTYWVTIYDDRGCSTVRNYTINDSNTITPEDQTLRDDCFLEFYCNNSPVLELTTYLGDASRYDPNDCRWYEYRCGDGGYYYPEGEESNRDNRGYYAEFDSTNCTGQRTCYNGEQYGNTVYGETFTENYHGQATNDLGLDSCIYCFTATVCTLTVDGEMARIVLGVESHLAAIDVPNSSSCEVGNPNSCLIDFRCSFLPPAEATFLENICVSNCIDESTYNLCTDAELVIIAQNFRKEMEQYDSDAYTLKETDDGMLVKIYPNPFHSFFYLEIFSTFNSPLDIRFTAMDGRLIKESKSHLLQGDNVYRIDDLEERPPGVYIITLYDKSHQRVMAFPITKFN